MGVLSQQEARFLKSHELCRLATVSGDGTPHVTPVVYTLAGKEIVIAIDYGTKKLRNLRENERVALVVDTYTPNRGVMVQGDCDIVETGREYLRLLRVLLDKFEVYRKNPWGEGESPILRIRPQKSVSWGLR